MRQRMPRKNAVYAMDQAEEDGVKLDFAVPEECTNLYFDGWVMLKNGIDGDADRKQAAEAFINFVSRPDNAVRNMYYIGYTSVIAGGDDDTVYSYLDYTYGAEDDAVLVSKVLGIVQTKKSNGFQDEHRGQPRHPGGPYLRA